MITDRVFFIDCNLSRNSSVTPRASMLLRTSCGLMKMIISDRCLVWSVLPNRAPRNLMLRSPGTPACVPWSLSLMRPPSRTVCPLVTATVEWMRLSEIVGVKVGEELLVLLVPLVELTTFEIS